MFTTKNGLYERARSKFKIQDGMKLFSYPFYKQRRKDLQVSACVCTACGDVRQPGVTTLPQTPALLPVRCGVRCAQAFFAQIYSEAQSSRAAPGHVAIAELHNMGRLQRHYTLNIDGLAAVRLPGSSSSQGASTCQPAQPAHCLVSCRGLDRTAVATSRMSEAAPRSV